MLRLEKFGLGREDYFCSRAVEGALKEADGEWIGRVAVDLGLLGQQVDAEALRLLFSGKHPLSGELLSKSHTRVSVAGFELTFAAPKSVSILFALADDETAELIASAHTQSVEDVLGYIERTSAYVRRRVDHHLTPIVASGFVAASFLHRTSRALDPHLHTHVLVANLAVDPEGKWSAFDARSLYRVTMSAQALYGAEVRHALSQRIGALWSINAEGFGDIVGIPRPVLREFSRRRLEIETSVARSGRTDGAGRRFVADKTRPGKDSEVTYEELVATWRERALRIGFSPGRVASLVSREVHRDVSKDEEWMPSMLGERDGSFTRADLVGAIANSTTEGASVDRVERLADEVLCSKEIEPVIAKSTARTRRGGSMPSEPFEQRFATRKSQARSVELHASIANAPEVLRFDRSDDESFWKFEPGLFVATTQGPFSYQLDRLRVVAAAARRNGRTVIGVAADVRRAAQFEALTAIETVPVEELSAVTPRALVVVDDPERFAGRALKAVFDRANAFCCTTIAVPRIRAMQDHERTEKVGQSDTSLIDKTTVVVGDVSVAFCDRLEQLLHFANQSSVDSMVVTVDERLKQSITTPSATIATLIPALAAEPEMHVVVLGGARLLGSLLFRIPDAQRTHLCLRPVSARGDLYGFAAELAEPSELRSVLGRPPADLPGRNAWRLAAKNHQRTHELDRDLAERGKTPRISEIETPGDRVLVGR